MTPQETILHQLLATAMEERDLAEAELETAYARGYDDALEYIRLVGEKARQAAVARRPTS